MFSSLRRLLSDLVSIGLSDKDEEHISGADVIDLVCRHMPSLSDQVSQIDQIETCLASARNVTLCWDKPNLAEAIRDLQDQLNRLDLSTRDSKAAVPAASASPSTGRIKYRVTERTCYVRTMVDDAPSEIHAGDCLEDWRQNGRADLDLEAVLDTEIEILDITPAA